jgi:hypothetical protein
MDDNLMEKQFEENLRLFGYEPHKQNDICELMLCESEKLILRPDMLYRFTVDENCEDCKRIRDNYKYWDKVQEPAQQTYHQEIL